MEIVDTNSENNTTAYAGTLKFSAFQPIDVKPVFGRNWVTNGVDNINFRRYDNAYDDSPTNASIINAFVNYMFGEGLHNNHHKYMSDFNQAKMPGEHDPAAWLIEKLFKV